MECLKYLVNSERVQNILPKLDIDLGALSFLSYTVEAGSTIQVTLFHRGIPESSPLKWKQRNYTGLELIFSFSCNSLITSIPSGLFGQTDVRLLIDEKTFKVQSKNCANELNIEATYAFLELDVKPHEAL